MKKIFMIAAIALLTLGMLSCNKDDENSNNNTNTNTLTNPTTPSNPTNPSDTTTTPTDTTTTHVPDGYVDLGLPSGLLWATCNLGSTTPEGYGNYYAWGKVQTKTTYDWSTYAYGSASNQLTKYCCNSEYGLNGFTDNLTTLQSSDDAATVVLGNGARIPTTDECDELTNNTDGEWTTLNGVNGWKFTASNGNSLFLLAAGFRLGSEFHDAGSIGGYWSSSLNDSNPRYAWFFGITSVGQGVGYDTRALGRSVRAVRSQN